MSLKVFSIYDSKADAYNQPFYQKTTGMAIRALEDELHNENSQLNKHSSDFTLFEIGVWDESKGVLEMYSTKKNLGVITEFKRQNNVNT